MRKGLGFKFRVERRHVLAGLIKEGGGGGGAGTTAV